MVQCKIDRLSLRNSRSHGFHATSDMHVQLAPVYTICDFQTGTKFVSACIDTGMKFRTRSRISFGLKTRMNLLRNDLYENKCHFGIVNKYREINGAGINSFQNEIHPGIALRTPKTTSFPTLKQFRSFLRLSIY